MKKKVIKALGDFVILKGEIEKSAIISVGDGSEGPVTGGKLKSLTVFSVGSDVKTLKKGDLVCVSRNALQDEGRSVAVSMGEANKDGEFYLTMKSDEIIGIYK